MDSNQTKSDENPYR